MVEKINAPPIQHNPTRSAKMVGLEKKRMIKKPEYRIIIATIILIYCMIVTALDGLEWYNVNQTIIVSLVGFSSALLTAGIIKQHKSFTN